MGFTFNPGAPVFVPPGQKKKEQDPPRCPAPPVTLDDIPPPRGAWAKKATPPADVVSEVTHSLSPPRPPSSTKPIATGFGNQASTSKSNARPFPPSSQFCQGAQPASSPVTPGLGTPVQTSLLTAQLMSTGIHTPGMMPRSHSPLPSMGSYSHSMTSPGLSNNEAGTWDCSMRMTGTLPRVPSDTVFTPEVAMPALDTNFPPNCFEQPHVYAEHERQGTLGPGDFQALREIGEGAFGKVYLVQSRTTGKRYAMKVLSKQTVLQKDQASYAMSERQVMSSLEHPFLVSLRFSFQTRHRLFLVMDYLEGGHLWLQMRSGFFLEEQARVFIAEMVLAIGHLHASDIAHRDLKPENILLDSENHLRLTDFGLAKTNLNDDARAHTMVGTIDYMAPEVVKNEGHGKMVDWWSLGVLLYEMLYARLPFAPQDARAARGPKQPGNKQKDKLDPSNSVYKAEVKRRIQNGKLAWPKGRYVNSVSKVAKDLITRLLTKSPKDRLGAAGVQDVMAHAFFKGLNWDLLLARKIPSPLTSSIFRGAPDSIGQVTIDPAPHEQPCAKLANYFFEKDTPPGSPRDVNLVSCFAGFSFVQTGELERLANAF